MPATLALPTERQFIDRHQLAEAMGVSTTAVDKLVHASPPIPHFRFGRKVVFDLQKVVNFLESRTGSTQNKNGRSAR